MDFLCFFSFSKNRVWLVVELAGVCALPSLRRKRCVRTSMQRRCATSTSILEVCALKKKLRIKISLARWQEEHDLDAPTTTVTATTITTAGATYATARQLTTIEFRCFANSNPPPPFLFALFHFTPFLFFPDGFVGTRRESRPVF